MSSTTWNTIPTAVAHSMGGELAGFCMRTDVGVASRTPKVAEVAALATKANLVMDKSGSFFPSGSRHTYVSAAKRPHSAPQTAPAAGVLI